MQSDPSPIKGRSVLQQNEVKWLYIQSSEAIESLISSH